MKSEIRIYSKTYPNGFKYSETLAKIDDDELSRIASKADAILINGEWFTRERTSEVIDIQDHWEQADTKRQGPFRKPKGLYVLPDEVDNIEPHPRDPEIVQEILKKLREH